MKDRRLTSILFLIALLFPFCGSALEIEEEEIRQRPSRPFGQPYVEHIFLEQESVSAFFEVTDTEEYRRMIPVPFSMPERPVCLVKFNNFYKMESAPPYFEAVLGILVKLNKPETGQELHGWYLLALTVTSEEALWGRLGGYPKVLRKVTLEHQDNRFVGISYRRDGTTPALKLSLDLMKGKPTRDEERFLDYISTFPAFTLSRGRVINRGVVGSGKYKIYDLERIAPWIWTIAFGNCTIEYPKEPNNYLARLGMGNCIAGYWLRQKARHKIPFKEE